MDKKPRLGSDPLEGIRDKKEGDWGEQMEPTRVCMQHAEPAVGAEGDVAAHRR